jgi:hypothetical protein
VTPHVTSVYQALRLAQAPVPAWVQVPERVLDTALPGEERNHQPECG